MSTHRFSLARAIVAAMAALLAACSSRSAPVREVRGAATLPGGTTFTVTLATPAAGALVAVPPGDVRVTGSVALGTAPASSDTALLLALDASAAPGAAAAACAGETGSTVLGCEVSALRALAARGVTTGTVGEVGAMIFAGSAAPLDLSPAEGAQHLVAPAADADTDGAPDVGAALESIAPGQAARFTPVDVAAGPPSLGAALAGASELAAASTRPTKLLVLVSAADAGAAPAIADVTVPDGLVIRAFAVGRACDAPSAFGTLAEAAARGAPGSACQEVTPGELEAAVATVLDATLGAVTLTVDGGPAVPLMTTPDLPGGAPLTAAFDAVVAGLEAGHHDVCVTSTAADTAGSRAETTCAAVVAATLALAPPASTYELGTPGQTATVTATVAAGEAGGVAGVPVGFAILEGPNAGVTGTVPTDANGEAAFTYPARQHLEGLGTDVVEACFTDAGGAEACARATVKWQDTTPPVVSCPPGPNPAGLTIASRAAGFMRLVAVDAVDPGPEVFLKDTGSGAGYGPFASGKAVKYTQAPGGKPGAKDMGAGTGAPVLHVIGTGDPAVVGEDAVGNVSAPLVCAVPPWNR
jgi:hypothetical protein